MESREILVVESYFDGERLHEPGEARILVENGVVRDALEGSVPLLPQEFLGPEVRTRRAKFAMPSLFEAHCHLFLDGEELDAPKRSAYLKGERSKMLAVAFANVERYRSRGVSGVRDAGDVHGINLEVREAVRAKGFTVVAAARGVRKRKRYGSFMAGEVDDAKGAAEAVAKAAAAGADAVKIVLTGIIDFENGCVKDQPQFSLEETRAVVKAARDLGLKTFAHCSGRDGLEIAVEAGVDSIEHGFFIDKSIVERMAERSIAWCPTFIPVEFQWAQPRYCGWSQTAVGKLRGILDNHQENLRLAHELGVQLLAGSDAGSYGVRHGVGLIEEIELLHGAGIPLEAALKAATSAPRKHMKLPSNSIKPGGKAEFVELEESPFKAASALKALMKSEACRAA